MNDPDWEAILEEELTNRKKYPRTRLKEFVAALRTHVQTYQAWTGFAAPTGDPRESQKRLDQFARKVDSALAAWEALSPSLRERVTWMWSLRAVDDAEISAGSSTPQRAERETVWSGHIRHEEVTDSLRHIAEAARSRLPSERGRTPDKEALHTRDELIRRLAQAWKETFSEDPKSWTYESKTSERTSDFHRVICRVLKVLDEDELSSKQVHNILGN